MNRRPVVLAVVALVAAMVVFAAAIVGFFAVAPPMLADRTSYYDYQATLTTNDTLTDVTLYLPMPVGPDGPMTGDVVVRDDDGNQVDATTGVVDTEHGPMLSIEVDRLEGSLEYMLLTFDEDGNLTDREVISPEEVPEDLSNKQLTPMPTRYTVHVFYDYRDGGEPIETKEPLDTEPTLSPKYALEAVDCVGPYADEEEACHRYDSMVYASYGTTEDNVVHVSAEYGGWNEWGWGLYNSYNEFTDRLDRTPLAGPQDGWTVAEGTIHAGSGSYPTRGN